MQKFTRRQLLGAAAAGAAWNAGCGPSPESPSQARDTSGPSVEALDRAAEKPILDLSGLDQPVIIDSIRLLAKDGEQFIHVRSKDGAEGLSLTNRRHYLAPILRELIIPFFLGKDARKLESELSGYALDSRRPHTLWSATAATAPSRGHRAAVVGPTAAAHCAPRGDGSG